MMIMNCFCGMVDQRKAFSFISSQDLCQKISSPSIWTCTEPEFRFWWMKLCSSDNHNTTAPYITTTLHHHTPLHHGAISFSLSKILKYFNDFQNRNFSVLRLKWTQTMQRKQNQTFSHWPYSNLTPYLFYIFSSKNIKVVQWLSKSELFSFMTKLTPNNGSETKSDIFYGTYSNLTSFFIGHKILKYFNGFYD